MSSLAKPVDKKPAPRTVNMTVNQAEFIEKFLGYATLIAIAALFVLPLYWMFSTAIKTEEQTFALPPEWIPNPVEFENFGRVFQEVPFERFIFNSFFLVGMNIIGELFAVTLVA